MEAQGFITWDGRGWRRLRALALKGQGWYQRDIAAALDVSEVTVSRWLARASVDGPEALLTRPGSGHPPKLSDAQKAQIPEFLWHGAEAYGFRGDAWTCRRIAQVIDEELGVRYHKDHVSRLLKELQWTPQVPIKRALQRDEAAIQAWRMEVWPDLRRRARRERRILVFVDESGFYLLPGVVRTYAPQAHTPVLRCQQTRDHLSVMGGMTPASKVYTLVRQRSLDGLDTVEFLRHLLRVAGQRLLVIWDGSPIHRRAAVKEFLSTKHDKLWVEVLPSYAPDLNPWDEGGWNHLKNVQLRNLVCRDMEELHEQFHLALHRLRQRRRLIPSFFAQAGLKL
jgi:transposase